MVRTFFAILGVIALSACASSGTLVSQDEIGKITDGTTTKSDIIARFGQPQSSTVDANGQTILTYVHASSAVTPVTFVPYVGLLAGGANTKSTAVSFVFAPNDILIKHASSETNNTVNTGLLNQH